MKWLFAPLAVVTLWACSSGSSTQVAPAGDAGAGEGGGLPCDPVGVSKGPWVLHVDGTSAIVRWETCRPGTPLGVSYAPEAGGAKASVKANETAFVVNNTIKNFSPTPDYAGTWYMHDAKLTGLSPSTCYAYGLDADGAVKARFCTARNPGDVVRFLAIGDTNPALNSWTKNVLAHAVPEGFDFSLHGGDIEYYDSVVETYSYWFTLMPPLLRGGAFFPAIGNHDSDDQSGEPTDKYEQYTERFWGDAGFDGANEYYAYSTGGVWFLTIDTEEPITQGSTQFQWVQKELAKASQSPGYRFSVLYLHRPYMTCGDTGDDVPALQQLQPLFTQYKVPLVIQAHMHGYERFETPNLTVVTTGGGGGLIKDPSANTSRSYCNQRVAAGPWYHAMIFEIDKGSYTAKVVDDSGITRDSFTHAVP